MAALPVTAILIYNICMNRKAFTLVELLVVIAIVGLISTIAITSTNSSRDKARIAPGLQLEATIQHAVGSDSVAMWDFDDGSGTAAVDTSGNGKNAVLHGGATWVCASTNKNYTPSGQGCAVNLNGTTGYVTTTITGVGDGTVSLWFNKQNAAATSVLIGKRSTGCFDASIYLNTPGTELRVYNAGPEAHIGNIQQGKWNHLAIVRSGSGTAADYYLNGKRVLTNAFNLNLNELVANIGSSCAGAGPFGGYIDNVRIFSVALSASSVRELYLAEKPAHEHAIAAK